MKNRFISLPPAIPQLIDVQPVRESIRRDVARLNSFAFVLEDRVFTREQFEQALHALPFALAEYYRQQNTLATLNDCE
jgi:hypothetical protein